MGVLTVSDTLTAVAKVPVNRIFLGKSLLKHSVCNGDQLANMMHYTYATKDGFGGSLKTGQQPRGSRTTRFGHQRRIPASTSETSPDRVCDHEKLYKPGFLHGAASTYYIQSIPTQGSRPGGF